MLDGALRAQPRMVGREHDEIGYDAGPEPRDGLQRRDATLLQLVARQHHIAQATPRRMRAVERRAHLADQTLVQFPDQLTGDEAERIQSTRAAIAAQQANRHWSRAEFYAKGKHYSSARIYYALIARDYPKTMLAQQARDRLDSIAGKEDVSDNPFPTLTALLNPDSLKEAELDAMAEAVRTTVADTLSFLPTPAGEVRGMSLATMVTEAMATANLAVTKLVDSDLVIVQSLDQIGRASCRERV